MGSISSSTGVISGLDIDMLVKAGTMRISNQIETLQSRIELTDLKKQATQQLEQGLKDLSSKMEALAKPSAFKSYTASGTGVEALGVSANEFASAGSYSVKVIKLAQTSRYATQGVASVNDTPLASGPGVFKFSIGDNDYTIDVDANTTLGSLRDAINSVSGGKAQATILNDGSGTNPFRMILESAETGNANALVVTQNDTSLTGLGTADAIQTAQDAVVEINGVSVTRSSNTFTDAITGVTFTANKVDGTTYNFKIAANYSSVQDKAAEFVNAYNALMTGIKTFTTYDTENKQMALLQGDSTSAMLRNELATLVSSSLSTGTYRSLADLGISVDKTGVMSLDSTKLADALAKDPNSVQRVFGDIQTSSNSEIRVLSQPTKPTNTTYTVNVTQAAERASLTSSAAAGTIAAATEHVFIAAAGQTTNFTITAGMTLDEIASGLNAKFSTDKVRALAEIKDGQLTISGLDYGSSNALTIRSDVNGIFTSAGETANGKNVIAEINGVSYTGVGRVINVNSGTFEGLSLNIDSSTPTTATVEHSLGIGSNMLRRINEWTKADGMFASQYTNYTSSAKLTNERIDSLNARLTSTEKILRSKYNFMESTLAKLQTQSNSVAKLAELISNMNKSSSK